MKKSNKLLWGGFLTVLLMIAGIHIALFAKYKNGKYTIYHRQDNRQDGRMKSFRNVSTVIIRNVDGATVQFGDSAEIEKVKDDVLQYVCNGSSLIIDGLNGMGHSTERGLVNITLPYNVKLSAVNSFLLFEKGKEDAENNPVIYLQKSRAVFGEDANQFQLGHLKVIASDSSIASFQGHTQVNNLEVMLSNSALEYNEENAGQLSIVTDSVSRLSLPFKHFLKAKITTVPNKP